MSYLQLRGRLTLLVVGAVGISLVLGSLTAYVALRSALLTQVDERLRSNAGYLQRIPSLSLEEVAKAWKAGSSSSGSYDVVQVLLPTGRTIRIHDAGVPVAIRAHDLRVARHTADGWLTDRMVGTQLLRVYTFPAGDGAVLIARSLSGANAALEDVRVVLALLVVIGTLTSAGLVRLFVRSALVPVTDLTKAAEHIQATGDLGRRVAVSGKDEVGRLAGAFNEMLDRVEGSVNAQRQLVADASHELRTPVSALRTNIEVLGVANGRMPDEKRRHIIDDLGLQADELGELVGDIIDLARDDDTSSASHEQVRLDRLVEEAVERARRHAPSHLFVVEAEPCVVDAEPDRLARAINNLLDNAAKYSDAGSSIDVVVRGDGTFSVRDYGPGVTSEEASHIFDRFARGTQARQHSGSGLGLAIVRQVADAHGGTVWVESPAGGGACFVLSLPTSPVEREPTISS